MSIVNFFPEITSTQLLVALRKRYVYPGLTNRNYEGEVRAFGDTVNINTPDPLTINSPATGIRGQADITYETPTSTQQVMLIDQSADFNFQRYSMDQLQANIDLMTAYIDEGADGLADTLDQNIAALYVDAVVTESIDMTAFDADLFQQSLIDLGTRLSEANVSSFGRWVTVDPRTAGFVRRTYGVATATEIGMAISINGFVTRAEGFDVFESNNVPITAGPDVSHCLAGTNAAITLAPQMEPSVKVLELEGIHGDGFQSLMVWGRRTVRPTNIVEWAVQHGA